MLKNHCQAVIISTVHRCYYIVNLRGCMWRSKETFLNLEALKSGLQQRCYIVNGWDCLGTVFNIQCTGLRRGAFNASVKVLSSGKAPFHIKWSSGREAMRLRPVWWISFVRLTTWQEWSHMSQTHYLHAGHATKRPKEHHYTSWWGL